MLPSLSQGDNARNWVGLLIPVRMKIQRITITYQDAAQRRGKRRKETLLKLTKKKRKKNVVY